MGTNRGVDVASSAEYVEDEMVGLLQGVCGSSKMSSSELGC